MTLAEVLKVALSGCVHEFHFHELRENTRESTIKCRRCSAEATAGEVAWMLAGGQLVRQNFEDEEHSRQQLMALAEQPAAGGVH